jgi:trehalose-phosphatase
MIELESDIENILNSIRKNGCILLLDFDGVLSRIVKNPNMAGMTAETSKILRSCAEKYDIAIISGRTLDSLKKRVDVKAFYVGNHGLEWEIYGKREFHKLSSDDENAVAEAKEAIKQILVNYDGVLYEDKPHVLGLNYRAVPRERVAAFKKDVRKMLQPFVLDRHLRLEHNKKTYELRPAESRNKGDSVKLALKHFRVGSRIPIYIGDGLTDEDAFKVLKDGITIRVRPNKGSFAKYFLKSRNGVDRFLEQLAAL